MNINFPNCLSKLYYNDKTGTQVFFFYLSLYTFNFQKDLSDNFQIKCV